MRLRADSVPAHASACRGRAGALTATGTVRGWVIGRGLANKQRRCARSRAGACREQTAKRPSRGIPVWCGRCCTCLVFGFCKKCMSSVALQQLCSPAWLPCGSGCAEACPVTILVSNMAMYLLCRVTTCLRRYATYTQRNLTGPAASSCWILFVRAIKATKSRLQFCTLARAGPAS